MARYAFLRGLYAVLRDRLPGLRGRRRLGRAAARSLALHGPVVVSSYGLQFDLDLNDLVEEAIFWEDYDRSTISWWTGQMGPGRVLFDVGANVGLYSLTAAAKGARVYAFEPNPRTRAKLDKNVRQNELQDRIRVLSEALCDTVGKATLYDDANAEGMGANAGVASLSPRNAGGRSIPVNTSTIDATVAELKLDRLHWIKMDIQGAELAALRGAADTLRTLHPSLVLEVDPNASSNMGWSEADLRRLLEPFGYRIRHLDFLNVVAEPR